MITTVAAKLWFAVASLATVAMAAYLLFSDAEWFGSMLLGTIATAALLLGTLAVAIRDGDVAGDVVEPKLDVRRTGPAPWPALGAVGAAVAAVGLAGRNNLLYLGLAILVVTLAEWMIQGWAERATGDPDYNRELRHRIMSPFEIPILSAIVVLTVMVSLSRVLLSVSKTGSTVVAIAVASTILLVASLLVARPRISSSVFAGVLAAGAVLMIGAGIAGGVAGERDIEEHHSEEQHEAEGQKSTPTDDDTTTIGEDDNHSTPASQP